jgi:putative heme-binding domain-containing protein
VVKTSDPHFRPVDLKLGPDGAIYIADWHEPNVTWNVTAGGGALNKVSGRIYRLKPTQPTQPLSSFQNYASSSTAQLLKQLDHPNQWHRETARRLLRERPDPSVLPRLSAELKQRTGQAALERLWALHASGGFTKELVPTLLQHPDAFVRIWTIRLLGDQGILTKTIEQRLVQLARSESHVQVRSQLACSAKRLPARVALPVVAALANQEVDLSDRYQPLLLWWAVEAKLRSEQAATLQWLEQSPLWNAPLFHSAIISRLGRRFTTERSEVNLKLCADLLALAPSMVETRELLRGMSQGLAGNKVDQIPDELEKRFEELYRRETPDAEMIQVAVRLGSHEAAALALKAIDEEATPEKDRLTLLQLLAERGDTRALTPLLRLLRAPSSSAELKSKVLGITQSFGDDQVAQVILGELPGFDRALRSKAFTILSSRRSWALLLLQKIDGGLFNPRVVPREIVLALQQSSGDAGQPLITKLWGKVSQTPREKRQRIGQVRSLLAKETGDPVNGKRIFLQACAGCHTLFGDGQKTGPDLTGIDRDSTDGLLDSIIDPSGAILPEYMAFQFTINRTGAEEQQVVTGYIVEENVNRTVLIDAAGNKTAVARQNILERQALTLSIMPEGLLDAYDDAQIRDLFAYLQAKTATRSAAR